MIIRGEYFACWPHHLFPSHFPFWYFSKWSPKACSAFCLEATFLISQPFQFFRKTTILLFSSSKVRCSRFLGRLLGSIFMFYFVALKNFKFDFFNSSIFQFIQAQVNVFLFTAFEYSYLAFTSLVIVVELCTLLCHEVIVLKFR